jgi:GDP-D-mannose dehydratase
LCNKQKQQQTKEMYDGNISKIRSVAYLREETRKMWQQIQVYTGFEYLTAVGMRGTVF